MNSIVKRKTIYSEVLKKEWDYCIYIPNNVPIQKMPILYLLHGASHSFDVWFTEGQLQKYLDHAIQKKKFHLSLLLHHILIKTVLVGILIKKDVTLRKLFLKISILKLNKCVVE